MYHDEEQLIRDALRAHTLPPFRTAAADWEVTADDHLYYRERLYIPPNDCLDILRLCHDHRSAGHPGIQRTLELIERSYWWPGLSTAVRQYVRTCSVCQQVKPHPSVAVDPHPLSLRSTRPWGTWSLDFITRLLPNHNYDAILVMVDHDLMKGVYSFSVQTHVLSHNAHRCVGWPQLVISDRGSQFTSHVTQTLAKQLGITWFLSMAYHPQTDGEMERMTQTLEIYL